MFTESYYLPVDKKLVQEETTQLQFCFAKTRKAYGTANTTFIIGNIFCASDVGAIFSGVKVE